MTSTSCSRCGAPATVEGTGYCAGCLLGAADAEAEAPILSGADESPPCELLSVIGETPRAVTFLGEQRWPVRRLVAFKLFKDERFCRLGGAGEERGVLRHPNIAPVLERGRLGGRPYLMTPFLSGGPLPRCCDHQRLGTDPRMRALLGVADALVLAHAHGAAHGRLTPSNVLCEGGAPVVVRIVDFDCNAVDAGTDVELDARLEADITGLVALAELVLAAALPAVPALRADIQRLRLTSHSAVELRDGLARIDAHIRSV